MPVTFKTKSQIAEEYGVCRKTMRKMMDAMPYDFPRSNLTPSHVKAVYEAIGCYPSNENESDWERVRLPDRIVDEDEKMRDK